MVTARKGWRPPPATRGLPPDLDGPEALPAQVRQAASDPEPLALLGLASSVLASMDPRTESPLEPRAEEFAELAAYTLVEALLAIDAWEAQLLARLMGQLSTDAELTALVDERLPRAIAAPPWVLSLDETTVTAALRSTDPLGDADNVVVELRLPDATPVCLISLVDHNLGSAVKDSFAAPIGVEEYRRFAAQSPDGIVLDTVDLPLPEVRGILDPAIEHSLRLLPMPETESWPSSLPLLEWALSRLPAPDPGDQPNETWDDIDAAQDATATAFIGSDAFTWDAEGHEADAAHLLVWLQDEFLGNGMHRSSPTTVEVIMLDLWVRKSISLSDESRESLPDLLRAWTRFVHARAGLEADLTAETLAAVDEHEPVFRRLLSGEDDAPLGVGEMLAQMLSGELGDDSPDPDDVWLDPLPDEPLRLPANLSDPAIAEIRAVLAVAEPVALDVGGVEFRTALRRTAAELAECDARIFTRGRSTARTAAALTWAVGMMNDLVGRYDPITAGELLASFDLTGSVTDRGTTMLHELGWHDAEDASARPIHLDLTTSAKRADYVELNVR